MGAQEGGKRAIGSSDASGGEGEWKNLVNRRVCDMVD